MKLFLCGCWSIRSYERQYFFFVKFVCFKRRQNVLCNRTRKGNSVEVVGKKLLCSQSSTLTVVRTVRENGPASGTGCGRAADRRSGYGGQLQLARRAGRRQRGANGDGDGRVAALDQPLDDTRVPFDDRWLPHSGLASCSGSYLSFISIYDETNTYNKVKRGASIGAGSR